MTSNSSRECRLAIDAIDTIHTVNAILLTLIRSRHQIAAFCACAAASGVMFMRWRRLDHDTRQRIWLLYGWFTGLMCCGSCIGAVTWAVWMQFLLAYYQSDKNSTIAFRDKSEAESAHARVSCVCLAPARIRACTAARVRLNVC